MFKTIEEIKSAHTGYFFSADTIRFFRSRISSRVHPSDIGTYLVTSERGPLGHRLYSIRLARPVLNASGDVIDCSIETVGEFQQYAYWSTAHAAAARQARL